MRFINKHDVDVRTLFKCGWHFSAEIDLEVFEYRRKTLERF